MSQLLPLNSVLKRSDSLLMEIRQILSFGGVEGFDFYRVSFHDSEGDISFSRSVNSPIVIEVNSDGLGKRFEEFEVMSVV
jgi:hypothetical protein